MLFRMLQITEVLLFSFLIQSWKASAELRLNPPWVQTVQYVGRDYSVRCEGEGEKAWRGPQGPIGERTNVPVHAVKRKTDNSLELVFNKIEKSHKGFYNCSTNTNGLRNSIKFNLIVIKPVTFDNTSREIVINNGESALLNCENDGEPVPEISWFFNDNLIEECESEKCSRQQKEDFRKLHIQETADKLYLNISNASWKNAGLYTCRAFQSILQTINTEKVYRLKVLHKPTLYPGQNETTHIYGFRNESRNITCKVMAEPVAYFIWYRYDRPMDPKKDNVNIYNEENISIMEVPLQEEKHLGEYRCEAANQMGILVLRFELELLPKPDTPKLLVRDFTHSMVNMTIQPVPEDDFTCRLFYTEYAYCSYEEKWRRASVLECKGKRTPEKKIHCAIFNLKPNTKYAIRGILYNEGGFGNYSDELLFRTRKEPITLSVSSTGHVNYVLLVLVCLAVMFV